MRRLNLDPLFTDDFFQLPEVRAQGKLNFPIPTDKKTIAAFFAKHGEAFHHGVLALAEELRSIAKRENLYDEKNVPSLQYFLKRCTYNPENKSQYYIDVVYPLLTGGVSDLAEMIAVLQSEERWTQRLKEKVKKLIDHLNMEKLCEPAMQDELHDMRLMLSIDHKAEFMSFRRELVGEIGSRVVNEHNQDLGGAIEIEFGSDRHYVYGLINNYHQQLGLERIDDKHAEQYVPTNDMLNDFSKKTEKALTASYIIEQILLKNAEHSESVAEIAKWLSLYGEDSKSFADLIANYDEEKDEYQLKRHAEYYLMHALFMRLANSGEYVNSSKGMKKHRLDEMPGVIIHVPSQRNIKLAYIEFADKYKSNEPFVLYYVQQFYKDLKRQTDLSEKLLQLCSPTQRKELLALTKQLLVRNSPWKIDDLSRLLDAFHTHQHRMYLFKTILSAGRDANTLAKALFTVWDANTINDNVIDFLVRHPKHADSLAELLNLICIDFKKPITESLLSFLGGHESHASTLVAWLDNDDAYDQFMNLVEEEVIVFENMGGLLNHVAHLDEIINALTRLYKSDPEQCKQKTDMIIAADGHIEKALNASSVKSVSKMNSASHPALFAASSSRQTEDSEPALPPQPPQFDD